MQGRTRYRDETMQGKTYRVLVGRALQLRGWFVEQASCKQLLVAVLRYAFFRWPRRCASWRKLVVGFIFAESGRVWSCDAIASRTWILAVGRRRSGRQAFRPLSKTLCISPLVSQIRTVWDISSRRIPNGTCTARTVPSSLHPTGDITMRIILFCRTQVLNYGYTNAAGHKQLSKSSTAKSVLSMCDPPNMTLPP